MPTTLLLAYPDLKTQRHLCIAGNLLSKLVVPCTHPGLPAIAVYVHKLNL